MSTNLSQQQQLQLSRQRRNAVCLCEGDHEFTNIQHLVSSMSSPPSEPDSSFDEEEDSDDVSSLAPSFASSTQQQQRRPLSRSVSAMCLCTPARVISILQTTTSSTQAWTAKHLPTIL
ncbi:hypothetical protein RI367_003393 [Sorochytrium milnesiophthora]